MPTLKDVASEAKVSLATASLAMRGKPGVTSATAQKVRSAAKRIGYQLNASARSLRSGRSGILVLIVPRLSIPFYNHVAEAVAYEMEKAGMQAMIQQSDLFAEHERETVGRIASTIADGIIYNSTRLDDESITALTDQRPVVMIENFAEPRTLDTVNTPSQEGMNAAVNHLVDVGCSRIGVLGRSPEDTGRASQLSSISKRTRYDAALAAIAHAGQDLETAAWPDPVSWSIEDGRKAALELARQGLPYDGLVCMNDMMALGVLRGFHEAGVKVPRDVAVIGFDGIQEGAYNTPTLSTIAVDYRGLAQASVSLMMRRLDQPDDKFMPQSIRVGYELIKRESTAR